MANGSKPARKQRQSRDRQRGHREKKRARTCAAPKENVVPPRKRERNVEWPTVHQKMEGGMQQHLRTFWRYRTAATTVNGIAGRSGASHKVRRKKNMNMCICYCAWVWVGEVSGRRRLPPCELPVRY